MMIASGANLVLKKLRVAFGLKDVDMHQVFVDAGFPVSKPELSALFRQPGHKNFRVVKYTNWKIRKNAPS